MGSGLGTAIDVITVNAQVQKQAKRAGLMPAADSLDAVTRHAPTCIISICG